MVPLVSNISYFALRYVLYCYKSAFVSAAFIRFKQLSRNLEETSSSSIILMYRKYYSNHYLCAVFTILFF